MNIAVLFVVLNDVKNGGGYCYIGKNVLTLWRCFIN